MANVGVNLSGNDMLSEALRSAQRSTDELRRSLDEGKSTRRKP